MNNRATGCCCQFASLPLCEKWEAASFRLWLPKEYKLTVKAAISFLFDSGEIVKLTIVSKPYQHSKQFDLGQIHETKVRLTTHEIEILKNHNINPEKVELSLEPYWSLSNQLIEKTLSISEVGKIKGKTILRPRASDYQVWLEKEKFSSRILLNSKEKRWTLKMESPEKKWNGEWVNLLDCFSN